MMATNPTSGGALAGSDENLETVAQCLFCGSGDAKPACDGVRDLYFEADPGEFTYLECTNCGSLWLKQRPVGPRLTNAYSAYYTHAAPRPEVKYGGLRGLRWSSFAKTRFAASSSIIDKLIARAAEGLGGDNSYIEAVHRFAPKAPAKILDYGCGSGEYLLRMQPFGYELYGTEYDPHLLEGLSHLGIKIEDVTTIEEERWQGEFDHITLSHVLEHVPDPVDLLARLFSWLKPGGTLFVEVPSAGATGLEIFGALWRGLEAPRHFSIPSKNATVAALNKCGFDIELQHISPTARPLVWDITLENAPKDEVTRLRADVEAAPEETLANAEFLTFLARKPS